MNCEFCNKELKNKGGLVKHQNGCNLNPNKVTYKSNFEDYWKKIKKGEIERKYTNGIDKCKKLGLPVPKNWVLVPSRLGSKVSNETKEKLSKVRSRILEEQGNGGFKNIKWYEIKNNKNEDFIVRGTWELKLAESLNKSDIYWVRKVYMDYSVSGLTKTYCPDFYIPEYNMFLEVKGFFSKKDKDKLEAVELQNNIKIFLIFEKDLKFIEKNDFYEWLNVLKDGKENSKKFIEFLKSKDIRYRYTKQKNKRINNQFTEKELQSLINRRKVERPKYEDLMIELKNSSYLSVGKKYNVSDNTVRKWVKFYKRLYKLD